MTTEKFELLGKRRNKCVICDYPVWAYVNTESDEYYLDCGCGTTKTMTGWSDIRKSFLYADGVEATGVEV